MDADSQLAQASSGDRPSREALFARHCDKLRLYVEYRLGRALALRVEVDDVIQETFLRAWRDIAGATLSGDSAFFGWLVAIARNVIVDIARASRSEKRQGEPLRLERSAWSRVGSLDPADSGAGPRTRAAQNEIAARMNMAFRALAPQHRRVIALRQFEQRSAREAAPQLGCSEQAVHALFRRALDAWAKQLERNGVDVP